MRNSGENRNTNAAYWLTVHDELLQGIAHTLSNRVATIGAAAYMLDIDGANVTQQSTILRGECDRLEELLHALRGLPRSTSGSAEPVMPSDVVRGAIAIRAQCGEFREIDYRISVDSAVPPAYGDPVAMQHALLIGLHAADKACAQGQHTGRKEIVVEVTGNADTACFTISCAEPVKKQWSRPAQSVSEALARTDIDVADTERAASAIEWLIAADGGTCTPHDDGAKFELPTLIAARRNR